MRAFSFADLRARLLLLVVLAVLPALGLILYTDFEQRRLAAVQVQDDALRLAQLATAEQAQLVQATHQLLIVLAQLPVVREGDANACTALFTDLLKRYPAYANLGASRANGEVFCSVAPLTHPVNVANAAWFQGVSHSHEFTVGEYQKSAVTDEFVLVLGYPVLDETNQLQAVVAASLDLARLNQLAAHARLPQGATLTAVDRNGTVIARYPDPQRWVGLMLSDAPLIQSMLTQGEGTTQGPGEDGIPRLYAFTRVRGVADVGMYVSIGIPTAVAFAAVQRRLVRNLVTLGIVSLFMLVAAWIGSDLLVLRPVQALVRTTKRLHAGDLRARTGLSHGRGELDQLAAAFDHMAEALEQREAARQRADEALQHLSRQLLEAQESERRAIARELHDELGQALQAIKINLQTARRYPPEGAQRLEDSIGIVDRALQQVRNLSLDLRPSLLDDLGLAAALEWYVERQAQRVGFIGHFVSDPLESRLPQVVETACFRVAQEALTNIARHAQARQVWVELQDHQAELRLVIRDDGVGFDVRAAEERAGRGGSFGLLGMRERVELVGGRIEVTSAAGRGSEICVYFPLPHIPVVREPPRASPYSTIA